LIEPTVVVDPKDVLDKEKALQALAALRHAKWFQVISLFLSPPSFAIDHIAVINTCFKMMHCGIAWGISKIFITYENTELYSH